MGAYNWRAIIFGGLAMVLIILLWLWLESSEEDSIDRKLGLKERCALVQPGWEIDRLHRHFSRRGWRSGCHPTQDCEEILVEGTMRRFRCDAQACEVHWQWDNWRCTVPLAPKSRLSLGAGTLDPHMRH